jgi:hypothetical protein
MEQLYSLAKLKEEGFKLEFAGGFKKGKLRMILCPSCNRITETREPINNGKISDRCFWCSCKYIIEAK